MSRESDLAWAAGIVDGEGCINISAGPRQGSKNNHHQLRLSITNTNYLIIQKLQDILGAGSIRSGNKFRANCKPCWILDFSSQKAEDAIRLLEPYLVGKKDQAEVALLSRQYIMKRGDPMKRGNPNIEQLEHLHKRLGVMNQNPPTRELVEKVEDAYHEGYTDGLSLVLSSARRFLAGGDQAAKETLTMGGT